MDEVTRLAGTRADLLGLPTQSLEDWRYVRCDTLKEAAYAAPRVLTSAELAQLVGTAQPALVVVDGQLQAGKSSWPDCWQEATAPEATVALATENDLAAVWALAAGGTRSALRITDTHPAPLQLVNIATGGISGWTLLLDVEAGTRLDLIIRHVAVGDARSCPAITIRAARGAQVHVSEFQATPWHHLLSTATIDVAADAQVHWTSVADGGACVRLATRVTLSGTGAHVALAGLGEVRERHQLHHLLRVAHAAGNTTSDQLFKAILHDRAQTSFDGLVQIRSGCDGSDAKQQNRNLLLSDLAKADTRPQLDIKADDVKAAHGATVGQLDADELFYLQCRGLDRRAAEALLTIGFAGEVLARLPHRDLLPTRKAFA